MSDQAQEMAELRNELESLKKAFSSSQVLLQATHHLALSLASSHQDGAAVAQAFEAFAARGDNHVLYAAASDQDFTLVEQLNEAISLLLLPAVGVGPTQ